MMTESNVPPSHRVAAIARRDEALSRIASRDAARDWADEMLAHIGPPLGADAPIWARAAAAAADTMGGAMARATAARNVAYESFGSADEGLVERTRIAYEARAAHRHASEQEQEDRRRRAAAAELDEIAASDFRLLWNAAGRPVCVRFPAGTLATAQQSPAIITADGERLTWTRFGLPEREFSHV